MAQNRKRVLFVDDDLSLLEIFQQLMAHYADDAWEVLTAPEVSQALGILQEGRVDLLVFDLQMPVVDGVQFLKLLQRRFPDLLKVVLTGTPSEETRASCLNHGAELYLEKPKEEGGWQSIYATLHELARFQPEAGFRGVLRRVGLADILQMECLARHSVVLRIRAAAVEGDVFVQDGQIIHAQCQGLAGEAAFHQLLAQTGGEFELRPFTEPPARTIGGSWEFLLMEAARQRDESVENAPAELPANFEIPDMFSVPKPAAPDGHRQPALGQPVGTPPTLAIPIVALRPAEVDEPASPLEPMRPRTDELLVCSLQGEVLHEWNCPNPSGRVGFLEFVSQKARQLAAGLPLGEFDRVEVNAAQTRVVAQVQAGRALFLRCSQVPVAGEGNSFVA